MSRKKNEKVIKIKLECPSTNCLPNMYAVSSGMMGGSTSAGGASRTGGYGGAGSSARYGSILYGAGIYGNNLTSSSTVWVYAIFIIILIVILFGRRFLGTPASSGLSSDDETDCQTQLDSSQYGALSNNPLLSNQLVDNSILLLGIIALLIFIAAYKPCTSGGYGGNAAGGYGAW